MTRLAALVAAVLVVGSGCITSVATSHWQRQAPTGRVYVAVAVDERTAANPAILAAVDHAAYQWSTRTNALTVRRTIGACPTGRHCIRVTSAQRNGGRTVKTIGGGQHLLTATVTITTDPTTTAVRRNIACHELGHALGLSHGPQPGPCSGGYPTAWDVREINRAYAPHPGG